AVLNFGSSFVYASNLTGSGGDVSGEWAYKDSGGAATSPFNNSFPFNYGFGAAGFAGTFGSGDVMSTNDRDNKTAPDGLDFGILPSGDNLATGSKGLENQGPMVLDSIVFTLSGFTGLLSDISG